MLTVLLDMWLEMVYIFQACILILVVPYSFAVYFLRFPYVILEALIEDWHGSCITELCIAINMTSMLFVSCWQ